jgi:hypothetical protein
MCTPLIRQILFDIRQFVTAFRHRYGRNVGAHDECKLTIWRGQPVAPGIRPVRSDLDRVIERDLSAENLSSLAPRLTVPTLVRPLRKFGSMK